MLLAISPDEIEPLIQRATAARLWPDREASAEAVPLGSYFDLLQRLSLGSGDETLGFSPRPLLQGTIDYVVEAFHGAASFEQGMRTVARAFNLMHGGEYNRVERRQNRICFLIDDARFPYVAGRNSPFINATMEGVLVFLHALFISGTASGIERDLLVVRTRRAQRPLLDGFLQFWTVPVQLGAPVYALEYRMEAAERAVQRTVASMAMIYTKVQSLIAEREHSARPSDFMNRVLLALSSGDIEQPAVARSLGVSVATLRRRLDEQAVSFRDLRVRALSERARQLLQAGLPPADVADRIGFADVRSFARAFKAWTGVTPAAYRAQNIRPSTRLRALPD